MNTLRMRKLCGVAAIVSCCATAVSCSPDSVKRSAGSTTSGVTKVGSSPRSGVSSGNARSPGAASSSKSGVSRRLPVKPSVAPPARPAGMALVSSQGAIAAAEHYLNLTAYAAATGDYAELEAMSGPDCKFCQKFIGQAKKLSNEGWLVKSALPSIRVEKSRHWDVDEKNVYQVDILASKNRYVLTNRLKQQKIVPAEQSAFGFVMFYNGRWIVKNGEAVDPRHWDETVDKS